MTIVVATHGGTGPHSTQRRIEAEHAITALGAHINSVWWDLPDGSLHNAVGDMAGRLITLIDAHTLLLAPVECDGHSDHEAVAAAAKTVVREQRAALLLYPVWLWHWATPDVIDWARLRTIAHSLRALTPKSAAIDYYTSRLSAPDGYPIIGSAVRARAQRVMESVLLPLPRDLAARVEGHTTDNRSAAQIAASFDAMLDHGVTDPWCLDESEYEKRRLALTLACLGRQHYPRVLEIGCATGQLSAQLRERTDYVIGMDVSARALEVARARTDGVDRLLGAAPADFPDAEFDLIVLSGVAYFFDGPELFATLRAARHRLRPGGEILIATWSAPTDKIPLDGPTVHEQAAALLDLPVRAPYRDADLTIEVWGEPISVYRECADTA